MTILANSNRLVEMDLHIQWLPFQIYKFMIDSFRLKHWERADFVSPANIVVFIGLVFREDTHLYNVTDWDAEKNDNVINGQDECGDYTL